MFYSYASPFRLARREPGSKATLSVGAWLKGGGTLTRGCAGRMDTDCFLVRERASGFAWESDSPVLAKSTLRSWYKTYD